MRRLVAALSFLSLANFVFVQGSSVCPLNHGEHHTSAPTASAMGGHEGHHMSSGSNHDVAQSAPARDTPHGPSCLTMGPCAVMLDITGPVVSTQVIVHADRMVVTSDHLPPSAVIAPELPPPRA